MDKLVQEAPVEANANQFWGAVRIYTEKPHIINRRLCSISNIWVGTCREKYSRNSLIAHMSKVLKKCEKTKINHDDERTKDKVDQSENEAVEKQIDTLKNILTAAGFSTAVEAGLDGKEKVSNTKDQEGAKSQNDLECVQKNVPWQMLTENTNLKVAVIRRGLPRQLSRFSQLLEVVIIDGESRQVSFFPEKTKGTQSISPRIHYSFLYSKTGITLTAIRDLEEEIADDDPNVAWLQQYVLPKVAKWAGEMEEDGTVENQGSIKLVDVQEYSNLYQKLKIKYGQALVEKWPEVTDPTKFVFEDVAIATYLILLWQQERASKGLTEYQSFVDLGCGNGLLVYILTGEGHKGLGIDLKKRNIWDMFPEDVKLKEGVVEPSDKNLFPEYDWLIGNHSDELTPWLPVIAAKSKYTTRFFVIPCCAHDFDCKFRRKTANKSQYSEYLEYVKEIGCVCGFEMWEDKLRIPSTKRMCLIGQKRVYEENEMPKVYQAIEDFIKVRNEANANSSANQNASRKTFGNVDTNNGENISGTLWSNNFKARDAIQPVRNCTTLKQDVKEDLISTVVTILLEKKHMVEVNNSERILRWDRGGSISMGDLAKRMSPTQLAALKNECGGLQTFLKNHKHIFAPLKGEVSLQVPSVALMEKVPKDRIKTKLCWFHDNHAQGCPLPSPLCVYAHGEGDLQKNVSSQQKV